MVRSRPRLSLAALLAATALSASHGARAHEPPPPVIPPFVAPAPGYCWLAIRLYDTLRDGPIDFCRQRLRYTPGALECYQLTDQVCASLLPSGQWIEGRAPIDSRVFRCPPGLLPPVCRRLDLR